MDCAEAMVAIWTPAGLWSVLEKRSPSAAFAMMVGVPVYVQPVYAEALPHEIMKSVPAELFHVSRLPST
jgi:hypothetical protein